VSWPRVSPLLTAGSEFQDCVEMFSEREQNGSRYDCVRAPQLIQEPWHCQQSVAHRVTLDLHLQLLKYG